MKQIQIEEVQSVSPDLMVVNAARVSHDKWKDEFDGKDEGLLQFLAGEQHTTPYRHPRIAIGMPRGIMENMIYKDATPFEKAGVVVSIPHEYDGYAIVKNSIFGWNQLIKQDYDYFRSISNILCTEAPHAWKAISGQKHELSRFTYNVDCIHEDHLLQINDPWLLDMTFRIQVPIWLARQLVKHQVGMVWSEVSRRYVSTPPEYFEQELRMKPEGGIKQGSGKTANWAEIPGIDIGDSYLDVDDVVNHLDCWYRRATAAGIAPETVRGYMPQNMMTTIIWSGHLPAFKHMVDLRIESHAQKEAQYFAGLLDGVMQNHEYADTWNNL